MRRFQGWLHHPLVAAHAEELYAQYMAKDGAR